jgi:hypothetical protein
VRLHGIWWINFTSRAANLSLRPLRVYLIRYTAAFFIQARLVRIPDRHLAPFPVARNFRLSLQIYRRPRYRAWHNQEAMSVTPDELRKLLRAAPFRPFQLHLADQRTFDVPHPEFVAIQPAGRWIVVVAPNELGGYEVVNLPLIVSMTVLPEPPASQQAA